MTSNTEMVPLFLDFEGVLRPTGSRGSFICAPLLLEGLLQAQSQGVQALIVVASTHRINSRCHELARFVDRDAPGISSFFHDVTPHGPRLIDTDPNADSAAYERAPRLFETQAWMSKQIARPNRWIAIDDTPTLYAPTPEPLPHELIVCPSDIGFGPDQARQLVSLLLGPQVRPRLPLTQ
jgi:hypothetical protein